MEVFNLKRKTILSGILKEVLFGHTGTEIISPDDFFKLSNGKAVEITCKGDNSESLTLILTPFKPLSYAKNQPFAQFELTLSEDLRENER